MMEEEDKIVQKTSRIRLIKDKMAGSMMLTFTLVSVLLVVLIGIGLVLKSLPILHDKSLWELLSGAKWKPMRGDFGFLPFIMGTLGDGYRYPLDFTGFVIYRYFPDGKF